MAVDINGRTVFNNSDINNPDIDGGTADSLTIGGTTPAAGTFTTLKQTTGKADGAIPISDTNGAFILTASTGSGAPVRATSPTLVTPALGTPSSGDISACTGTPTINVTLPDAGKITLDIAPASDHTATGIQFSATAGEALAYGNVCCLKSDGKYWKIDADAAATMPATVMALATIAEDTAGNFLDYGWARDDSWSWIIGGMVYASTDSGGLTQTAPSGEADNIQIVGKAETATVLKFAPSWITAEVGLDVVNLGTATSTTITFAEMSAVPKTWMADHSSDQTITFAAPTAADVGKRFTILKNGTGAGKLIVDAPSGVYLHSAAASSGDGGTAYLAASARGSMTWFVASATEIQLLNADGTVTFT